MAMNEGELWAPYGPPATLLHVIRHYRQRDVPERLTATHLRQIGVGEGLLNRTMAAMRFLDLIREDGTTTDNLRALRFATDAEYQQVFRGILEQAYSNIFSAIGDTSAATDQRLRDAFHPYTPGAQRARMITFFQVLCREAGFEFPSPPRDVSVRRTTTTPRIRRQAASSGAGGNQGSSGGESSRNPEDAALLAWFNTRPNSQESWSKDDRERWFGVLKAMVDGIYSESRPTPEAEGGEDEEGMSPGA